MNVSHFVNICQVLTTLHELICRCVANFGTRCISLIILKSSIISPLNRLYFNVGKFNAFNRSLYESGFSPKIIKVYAYKSLFSIAAAPECCSKGPMSRDLHMHCGLSHPRHSIFSLRQPPLSYQSECTASHQQTMIG